MDPLADVPQSVAISPYHYVANNPILNIDPDGRDWKPTIKEDGQVYYVSEDNDSFNSFVDQYGYEAANEVFNNHCSGCYDKDVKYNKGEISLKGDAYPLIIETTQVGSFLMRRTVATTEIQKIYNQLNFASEFSSASGSSTFNFDDYFTNTNGGAVRSFDIEGPIFTETGGYVPYGFIGYNTGLNTSKLPLSNPTSNPIPGGIKYEYRAGRNNVPLLVTLRTERK